MAYFPKIGPFYDPKNEQEFYGDEDGSLRLGNSRERRDSGNGSSFRRPGSNPSRAERDANIGWTDLVQDQGSMFYVESNGKGDPRLQHPAGINVIASSHSRQSSRDQSEKSNSPRSYISHGDSQFRNGSLQYDETGVPGGEKKEFNRRHYFNGDVWSNHNNIEQLSQGQFLRGERQRQSDGSSQSDQSYTSFSNFLESNTGPPRTSQRNDSYHNTNSNRVPHMNISQSGKRKSVNMVPNLRNINDINTCSGVTLCELLFGIKLCHYKQKPPHPNGTNIDQVLRDRKVIVQGVIQGTQADICGQIHRGDMLVCLNDTDVTWVNIDDLFRHIAQLSKVKLTFQVPNVIGPKQSTPPVTPTRSTPPPPPHIPLHSPLLPPRIPQSVPSPSSNKAPPIPPHIPLRQPSTPSTPPPRPHFPRWKTRHQDLVSLTTGETLSSLGELLRRHLFAVMYLTLASQSEDLQDDVIYQYPALGNKVVEVRGLFLTLARLIPDITNSCPTVTTVEYRGGRMHVAYWRSNQDILLISLPETHVPKCYLLHTLSNLIHVILVMYGSVSHVFRDREFHEQLDQLLGLTVYRLLATDVSSQATNSSPLEPQLLDTMTGVRWLRLACDDKTSCDEILNEYEAQDFSELDNVDPDVRRSYGIIGSCVYYKDFLLCSHVCPEVLQDIHLFLKYHSILHLVNKQPVEELVIWREFYPTYLCHQRNIDNPGFREPSGRWFLLIVGLRHFLHCTLLECGSYASLASGKKDEVDKFFLEQAQATLAQFDIEDTEMELRCNERLYTEMIGPRLRAVETDRHMSRQSSQISDVVSPLKSPVKIESSPRYGGEDGDYTSVHSRDGPGMKRQGSRLSFGSNDSNGSSSGTSIMKLKLANKKGSSYDISTHNRSFSEKSNGIKLTRGLGNLLFHYVNFSKFEGIYVSPTPCELSAVQGTVHEHMLYNFYGCCMRLHQTFKQYAGKQMRRENPDRQGIIEEAVMFTCQVGNQSDSKRPPTVLMYWVIGRLCPDNHEMFVCIEDGAPQSLLELAFNFNFGIS